MTYRLSTRHSHYVSIDGTEVEVDFQPAYDGYILHERVGNRLVVAYLVHDDDYRDIDDMMGDGMGTLYDRRSRHGNQDSEALGAMGYDRYGDPDLDHIFGVHLKDVIPRYVEKVLECHHASEVVALLNDAGQSCTGDDTRTPDELAPLLLHDDANSVCRWGNVYYDVQMEQVLEEMFSEPEYRPGDPDYVLCDVYEHGGSVWSLHGGGMRCQWDTSNGAGVWVPDDCLRKELDNVNPWAFVRRTPVTLHGTNNKYQLVEVKWNEDGPVHVDLNSVRMSDDWSGLHAEAKLIAEGKPEATARHKRWARNNQAEEYARQYLDQYNDIINGNVYGCVVQTYELQGDEDDPQWVEVGSNDACWGFIGSDHAMEALKSDYLDPTVENLKRSEVAA